MSAEQQTQDAANGQAPPDDKAIEKNKLREPKLGDDATEMGFYSGASFALLQRVARVLSESTLVPERYRGNLSNCMIALNMSSRLRADPLMVMQNLYVVHGSPGWSAQFLIATLNQSGNFTKLRYEWKGEPGQMEWGCRAWAIEKATNEKLAGTWVTWKVAVDEGWVNKNGSKWKSMPEQMFCYRAAAFFVRAYAPEIAMGLPTTEELNDVIDLNAGPGGTYEFQEVQEGQPVRPNGGTQAQSFAERLQQPREGASPVEENDEASAESVADSSPSTEEPKEATEEPADDGGMAAEDELRAEAQALYDRLSKTQGKVGKTRAALQALGVASVKEISVEKLSGFIDTLNSI